MLHYACMYNDTVTAELGAIVNGTYYVGKTPRSYVPVLEETIEMSRYPSERVMSVLCCNISMLL